MSPQHRGWSTHLNTTRQEDLTFLAETGETPERAATRLGLTLDALEKWCSKHAPDTWAQLAANRTTPGHGARQGRLQGATR